MIGRHTVDVSCPVEIERTADYFYAFAIPQGIEIEPGDTVLVHGAPAQVAFGTRMTVQCRATVTRAGRLRRAWTRLTGLRQLTELYEVGFAPENVP